MLSLKVFYFKSKKLKGGKILCLGLLLSMVLFSSCIKEEELSPDVPLSYHEEKISSYGELFDVFWKVMDERYNYFYEQKRRDGMDWQEVYRKYSPKFRSLKSYSIEGYSDSEISSDSEKAAGYFREIISPVLDRHFYVDVYLPRLVSGGFVRTLHRFFGLSDSRGYYPFDLKYGYMQNRLGEDKITFGSGDGSSFSYLGGSLKSHSDIYYFTFNEFLMSETLRLDLSERYLSSESGNPLLLKEQDIDSNSDLQGISDPVFRSEVRDFTKGILKEWDAFFGSSKVSRFNNEVGYFLSSEDFKPSLLSSTEEVSSSLSGLVRYGDFSTYNPILRAESLSYIRWFMGRMSNHVQYGYGLERFERDSRQIRSSSMFYQRFLNPLHRGEIKKLILDLRDNNGGAIVDFRYFVERMVSNPGVYAYQRTKEGSGRFSYTPWVGMHSSIHRYGVPGKLPIVVLTDSHSASMSELSTLMLKSQGGEVISVGDYSYGATAGLYPDPGAFNGGSQDFIGGVLRFNIPSMATKTISGEVIEGVGVKPDVYVSGPSVEELRMMRDSPQTFKDRVLNEAIRYLSSR
ncbi:S41 family peptidase [Elizabethkingia anophelis]|uniref:Tail specific protease domain-containing protein n=1 Tax=Elizabethkingia anophelis TaxID=1117645 RepID=A0AAU8UZ69_9FLAO|nr:S41 family peptidase [Elizabethkingia anophelis]AQX02252.1 hypothetical protein BBD32_12685 [Elizabethkingia anophelis]OPB63772.1 hypothetical protein BAY11_16855 [Elizabethkingia anophelis]